MIQDIKKCNSFNFIRLICCLIVIYEHTLVLTQSNYINLELRGLAVNTFFILSGFWVTQSYFNAESIKDYFFKRIRKIFPQYILVVILCASLLVFFSSKSIKDYFTSLEFYKYIFANVLTLNFIHPNLPGVFEGLPLEGAVNGSLWTIKVEIGFYILLPLIVLLLRKLTYKNKDCYSTYNDISTKTSTILLLIIYTFSVLYDLFMPKICEKYSLPNSLANQLPAYLSYFICGMMFVFCEKFLFSKLNKLVIPCSFLFIICKVFNFTIFTKIFLPFILSIIVMWLGTHLSYFNNIGRKNDYSYSMYLIHYPIIMCFVDSEMFQKHWMFSFIILLSSVFSFSILLEIFQKKVFENKKYTVLGK